MSEAYKNKELSAEERARDLLSHMSLEEKIGQLNQVSAKSENTEENRRLASEGLVGSMILASTAYAGNEEQTTMDLSELNETQRIAVEESRLGIPIINGRDIIHGHRTVFPIPLAQGASWDRDMVREGCRIAAKEATATGVHWTFAPMVDVSRDPRWGRVMECYGEDPYLNAVMGTQSVRGFQGDNPSHEDSVLACMKHFAAYGGAEGGRDYNTVECSDDTLRNIYLAPFRKACKEGKAASVMSGFHSIGGSPVSASKYLQNDILKKEWDWDGFVISDWGSVIQLINHGVAEDKREATLKAFNAGVDMDMADNCYIENIAALIKDSLISEERLNDAVYRVLLAKFRAGIFENPYIDLKKKERVLLTKEHRKAARKAGTSSMVLLKNNGVLPLSTTEGSIVITGEFANSKRSVLGNWTIDHNTEDTVSVLEGIENRANGAKVVFIPTGLDSSVTAVSRVSDITEGNLIIYTAGESHQRCGEACNISDIILPPQQEDEIKRLKETGKSLVVVVFAGRPLNLSNVLPYADAVVYAWHPGTECGNALADILFGDVNPSAKLPMTFPRSTGQIPLYYNKKPMGHDIDEYYVNTQRKYYKDISASPLFPFGFGLSYTEFEYSNLILSKSEISSEESINISVTVKNVGERDGEEVVQCYIQDVVATVGRPFRELKAFDKVFIKAKEEKTVCFSLTKEDLAFYLPGGERVAEAGLFRVFVGKNCLDTLSSEFRLTTSTSLER